MSTPARQTPRFVSRLTKDTLALILAGGGGTRLLDLTRWRAKPSMPFGGKFRIIDFPLSNCINSDLRRIGVLSQYKAYSLIRHIQQGWGFLRAELNEFVELLPAMQHLHTGWYAGTADAIYQNIDIIRRHNPRYVLILGGDHIYKMDYGNLLAFHAETGADITVGCIEVPLEDAKGFGVMQTDGQNRVTAFQEKPAEPQPLPGSTTHAMASMGIYVFETGLLCELLASDADDGDSSHDFGKDIIPSCIDHYHVAAFPFRDPETGQRAYWRDVGTVESYWSANLELLGVTPELNLYDHDWPIWTYQEQLPPAKFVFDFEDKRGMALDSMVSGGCIVSGATVSRSLLFSNVHIENHTVVEDSVILPDVRIGAACKINKAVIDKGVVIPDGTIIGYYPDEDRQRYRVTDHGVTLVVPEMLGQEPNHLK
ncbi:MAG: glucose-1-phosphate adenylyltransferase [Gammaproteobacteria bacterium]|nr:glucose-1-phosphate adenylyltransferase [Gammaproteobacteria bacterium]NNF61849.1 glucose-1-phosphate adenylyltransferase [Gammaproteobacteria bacterium]